MIHKTYYHNTTNLTITIPMTYAPKETNIATWFGCLVWLPGFVTDTNTVSVK